MKKTIIASLVGLAFAPSSFAEESIVQTTDVVVTATRFSEPLANTAANVKIISKEEIESSPATSIPDLLRMQAGINVTNLYGNQGIDASVDIRGFGDTANSNTLILLDGQRLNGVDSASIQWASIPLQAIDHIEIIAGGGSVLYGDRASGGVINIITDKSGKTRISATGTVGSYGYTGADAFVSGGSGDAYFNTFVHTADSTGWRENTDSNLWSASGRGGVYFNNGEAFLDFAKYRIENGLPGSISSNTFRNDPRSARTPFDSQTKDGYRLRPGVAMKLNDAIELAAEVSAANEDQHFDNVSFSSVTDRVAETYSFTPRVKWTHGLGKLSSATIVGYDYYHGRVTADNHGSFDNQNSHQTTNAVYAQNTTAINGNLDLGLGLREEKIKQDANQGSVAGSARKTKSAYDVGLTYHETGWSLYSKLGSSFRFANIDELFNFDSLTLQTLFSGQIIKPQTARNQEIGFTFKQDILDGRFALYHTNVTDEIGFDGTQSINTNFDPTRHQGLEAELGWQIVDNVKAKFSYTYDDAEFRSGTNKGNQLPSAPQNIAHAQLNWSTQYGQYVAQANYVGERYTSGDFANALDKLPSYTTLDLRANWDLKPVTISLIGLNVLDKKYSPFGLFSSFRNDYFYFPADGRTFYLSARYDFK